MLKEVAQTMLRFGALANIAATHPATRAKPLPTAEGLQRILKRTGWEILDFTTFGARFRSDPASPARDERAFCVARSRVFKG